jgi:hypothetical protein
MGSIGEAHRQFAAAAAGVKRERLKSDEDAVRRPRTGDLVTDPPGLLEVNPRSKLGHNIILVSLTEDPDS